MMWNSWGNMWGGGFGFGWIFMLVFWGLIIWGIFALVRGAGGHGGCCGHGVVVKGMARKAPWTFSKSAMPREK